MPLLPLLLLLLLPYWRLLREFDEEEDDDDEEDDDEVCEDEEDPDNDDDEELELLEPPTAVRANDGTPFIFEPAKEAEVAADCDEDADDNDEEEDDNDDVEVVVEAAATKADVLKLKLLLLLLFTFTLFREPLLLLLPLPPSEEAVTLLPSGNHILHKTISMSVKGRGVFVGRLLDFLRPCLVDCSRRLDEQQLQQEEEGLELMRIEVFSAAGVIEVVASLSNDVCVRSRCMP